MIIELIRKLPPLQWDRWRPVMPFASSLLIHALVLLALALWMLPILSKGQDVVPIDAGFMPESAEARQELSRESVEFRAADSSSQLNEVLTQAATQVPQPPTVSTPAGVNAPQAPRLLPPRVPTVDRLSDEDLAAELPIMMSAMPMHLHRGQTRVEEAEDTAAIARTLNGDLMSIARDGDAMIVWMLDQSLSMQLDMKVLATQLLTTLQEIEKDKTSNMQHFVVAFGDGATVFQNATDRGTQVASAIYNLPPDPSGVENTFQSVEWCIDNLFNATRWLRGKPRQRLLVIWTDESGDDYLRLEHTIQRCLQANVRVDIIGPSAVLGAQTGYTAYPHPADGRTYYLPVHRGPDSSFPQKLALGYWHRGVPAGYDESFRGPYQGLSPRWQGGTNMVSMLSGFSPYALTRLARQTGGRFTIHDRPGDRPPFRLDQIRDYSPDYRSISEIGFSLHRQPLRQLVLAASAVTWQSPHTAQSQPPLIFRPERGGEQGVQYRRNTLPKKLKPAILAASRTAFDVERALSIFANAATAPGFRPQQDYAEAVSSKTTTETEDRTSTAGNESPPPSDGDDPQSDKAMPGDSEKYAAEIKADGADNPEDIPDLEAMAVAVDATLLEQLYAREDSKRWRAWCDLNMGRLLCVSVRLREYLLVTTELLSNVNGLNPDTNYVQLVPSANLAGGAASLQRAELARRILQRCVEQNPGTPWSVMAERELRDGLGLQIRQQFIPQPKPSRTVPGPRPQRPTLPNL